MTQQERWRQGGIPFDRQERLFESAMEPRPAPQRLKEYPETHSENPDFFLGVLEKTLEAITKASSVSKLHMAVVILNVNEFKLPQAFEEEGFEELLDDFQRWTLRSELHFVGGETARTMVRQKLEEVVHAARKKFQDLCV